MKVRSLITRLILLNTYLPYFPPDCPGQLVISLPDDDTREILNHVMPNMWKKQMVEQEYNYLDGPIHSKAEFFGTTVENLENQSQEVFPRKNPRKGSRKRNQELSEIPRMKIPKMNSRAKSFASTMARADIPRTFLGHTLHITRTSALL